MTGSRSRSGLDLGFIIVLDTMPNILASGSDHSMSSKRDLSYTKTGQRLEPVPQGGKVQGSHFSEMVAVSAF